MPSLLQSSSDMFGRVTLERLQIGVWHFITHCYSYMVGTLAFFIYKIRQSGRLYSFSFLTNLVIGSQGFELEHCNLYFFQSIKYRCILAKFRVLGSSKFRVSKFVKPLLSLSIKEGKVGDNIQNLSSEYQNLSIYRILVHLLVLSKCHNNKEFRWSPMLQRIKQ